MASAYESDRSTMAVLSELKDALGVASESEVLRQAIALLRLARDVKSGGGDVVLENGDGTKNTLDLS